MDLGYPGDRDVHRRHDGLTAVTDFSTQQGNDAILTDVVTNLNGEDTVMGWKVQRVKAGHGGDGVYQDTDFYNPLPVMTVAAMGNTGSTSSTLSAVGQTLDYDVAKMGNGSIFISGGTYTGLTLAFEASPDGALWFPLRATRPDGTAIETAVRFTAPGTRGWNFTAGGIRYVRVRVVAITGTTPSVDVSITAGPGIVDFAPAVARLDGTRATYTVQTIGNTMNSATDYLMLTAGSQKTVRISHVDVVVMSGSTTATNTTIQLLRRTTATSGGTAANPIAYDSLDPAAGAAGRAWTGTAGTVGTAGSVIRAWRGGVTSAGSFFSWDFATIGKAPVLRPGEIVVVNNGTALSTSANWSIIMEFTEE